MLELDCFFADVEIEYYYLEMLFVDEPIMVIGRGKYVSKKVQYFEEMNKSR